MITSANTALVLVDVQAKLAPAMHDKEILLDNLKRLVRGIRILGVPILWTEQNPAGLGSTLPEIVDLLPDQKPVSKFSFSCCGSEQFRNELNALNRKNMLIAGIEAHVCVYQTAADLIDLQYELMQVHPLHFHFYFQGAYLHIQYLIDPLLLVHLTLQNMIFLTFHFQWSPS